MKPAIKFFILLGVCSSLIFYTGCSSKHPAPPSITDQQITTLTKADWLLTAATKDGVDQMADYVNFKLTLAGTLGQKSISYTAANFTHGKTYPWSPTGTFAFDTTNPATTLLRDDGVTITYSATATQLIMSFDYTLGGYVATRTSVVTGQWVFTFGH